MVIVIMGVSGCGKTTVGRALADRLGCPFLDGDDVHPEANRRKMAAGTPLTDADRGPWLDRLAERIRDWCAAGQDAVVACSALKQAYREVLRVGGATLFIHLTASRAVLLRRLEQRSDHFFPPGLLDSQLHALEPPESAVTIPCDQPVESQIEQIMRHVGGAA